jgi:hypothetical protein
VGAVCAILLAVYVLRSYTKSAPGSADDSKDRDAGDGDRVATDHQKKAEESQFHNNPMMEADHIEMSDEGLEQLSI